LQRSVARSAGLLDLADAKKEVLVAEPFLPHVLQACATEIDLSVEQARELGFDQGPLRAIDEAHR
jgi:hypothetical protein